MKLAYAVPHPVTGAILQRVTGIVRSLTIAHPDAAFTVLAPSLDESADGHPKVEFVSVEAADSAANGITKVVRRVHLGRETVRALDFVDPDLVIIYGGGALYMSRIQSWARARGKLVAADAVEWYDASHLPGGRWGPFALDNELMMRRTLLACDGAITISTFLAEHVSRSTAMPVVVVPPLLDLASIDWETTRRPRQRLVYCGNPGLKDDLGIVIQAIAQVDPEGQYLELKIAGPDATQVAQLPGVKSVPPSVRALGRLSSADSVALMASATWAPLVRPDRRFAHAGFPTKMVEALAVGTPPIVNITSDLGRYLVHGENALVLRDARVSSLAKTLEEALLFSVDKLDGMSRRARATAENNFDIGGYPVQLGAWLSAVASKGQL